MNRRPDPLDPNERALADLLARDAVPGPSPQLDARILAAARTAASTPERMSRRPRPRWIAGMSIAATLVLAVGIAWRLRPLPERPTASEAPTMVSAVRVIEPPARVASPQPPAAVGDVVYRQAQSPPAQVLSKPAPAERESAAAADKASPPPEPPAAFDRPSPMDTQAPSPAPPPPAPAVAQKAAANGMAAPTASTMQAEKTQARTAAPDAFEPARAKEDARTLDRIETTGSRIRRNDTVEAGNVDAAAAANAAAEDGVSRAVLDEEPPATADSPQVQEAWLQRIRELLSAGETEAARNSLGEFRRRYPKYALPEDLRRLATP